MRKEFSFDELSDKRCVECGKQLKKRIAQNKPTADLCFACHKLKKGRGHFVLGEKK